jgi:hypothetical protein
MNGQYNMKLPRLRRQSGISAKPRFVPSALTDNEITGIYQEIHKWYEQIPPPRESDKSVRNDSLRVLLTVFVPYAFLWWVAYAIRSAFPHDTRAANSALALFLFGVALFVVFSIVETVRSVKSSWARIKRGALDDFSTARKRSEIDSRFVNALVGYDENRRPAYGESVRRFTVTELRLLKKHLESWRKSLIGAFTLVVAILVFFDIKGDLGNKLAEFANTLPFPVLVYATLIASTIVFFVILFNNTTSFERISSVNRVIVLIRFSLGDVDDEDTTSSELKIEVKDDDGAPDKRPARGLDDAVTTGVA